MKNTENLEPRLCKNYGTAKTEPHTDKSKDNPAKVQLYNQNLNLYGQKNNHEDNEEKNNENNNHTKNHISENQPHTNELHTNNNQLSCPYCKSKDIAKRGTRKNKIETLQLYLCKICNKTFTRQQVKGKKFPLAIILETLNYYNQGYPIAHTLKLIKENHGLALSRNTFYNWLEEFKELCTYRRLRELALGLYSPDQVIQSSLLYHKQVYKFMYHKAKTAIIIKNNLKFRAIKDYLDSAVIKCPHKSFSSNSELNLRSSNIATKSNKFDLSQVIINEKFNYATRIANLVLQSVDKNKKRHELLQKFMLINDSVTIACEIPVYLTNEDIEHFKNKLNFKIPLEIEGINNTENSGLITGHIDLLQIRNNLVHILDYKPNAKSERPIEQLTIYALALSRLTGLRLYDFKCAWFDDKNYYEFFPLHVVYKTNDEIKARTRSVE